MKLVRLKIENHRRLADLDIAVRDHLVLVGANDVGKSSLLRCLDLLLGASTAQLYSTISAEDFRDSNAPLLVEGSLSHFGLDEMALFPDEIDTTATPPMLIIRLTAEIDPNGTVTISRTAPKLNMNRQLSREQLGGLGWKFLSATAQKRDLRDGRKTAVDDLLESIDLGDEKVVFDEVADKFQEALGESRTLGAMRDKLASQLSRALPKTIQRDDLGFVSRASADGDPLSDVRLQVLKEGAAYDLSEQSDGTRALYAIALYDLMTVGSNVVGIDEPEVHLHPTSQRSLARLLRYGANQKILATHSADIVGVFDPDSIVVVKTGGVIVQPRVGFMSDDEKQFVRWWVRDKLEPLTATRIVAVEGVSDRIILERAAEITNRQLDRLGVSVLEVGGAGDMGVIDKLFGKNGFDIPMSLLIDDDAEVETAKKLNVDPADLPQEHVWVSRRDLEDEYVRAVGVDRAWEALSSSGLFTKTQLSLCALSGASGERTIDDIADFCRKKKHKVAAALSIAGIMNSTDVTLIGSIDCVLGEVAL